MPENRKLLIINSIGGKEKYKKILELFYKYHKLDIESSLIEIKITENEQSIGRYCSNYVSKNPNGTIYISGGDGSLFQAVNACAYTGVNLILIPNGTGNDFAKYVYGYDYSLEYIVKNINSMEYEKVDLIKVNNDYCINVLSFGYDTIVLDSSIKFKAKYPTLGKYSFIAGVLKTLNKIKPIEYSYKFNDINGKEIRGNGKFLLSAICNAKYFGNGFTPAPDASITDGIIEINQVRQISLLKFLHLIKSYKNGSHLNTIYSRIIRARSGTIRPINSNKIFGNIDGEIFYFDEINFEIKEKIINLGYLENQDRKSVV